MALWFYTGSREKKTIMQHDSVYLLHINIGGLIKPPLCLKPSTAAFSVPN